MKKILFCFISILFFSLHSFAQNIEEVKRISNTYGFLLGQEYSLNLIKKKFPDMKLAITKADLEFKTKFGRAKDGMKKYLLEVLTQKHFKEFENTITSQFKEMFPNNDITRELAITFIKEIEERAIGKIATPILETLLSFQYADYPQEEFSAGYKNTFRTKGHLKSKNTDWQIEIPKSWLAKEAIRPNIIQQFISNYGNGTERIM